MGRFHSLGTFAVLGIVCLVLAQAWVTRGVARDIAPQLVQDDATYCRNWQSELASKASQYNASCLGSTDRQCGQWKEDLAAQTARFNGRCPG